MQLHRKKKVEIIADAATRDLLATIAERSGAKGHTLMAGVSGKGSRGVRASDDLFGVLENVHLMVVCSPEVADRLVALAMDELQDHARIVLVSDVDVVRDEHF